MTTRGKILTILAIIAANTALICALVQIGVLHATHPIPCYSLFCVVVS